MRRWEELEDRIDTARDEARSRAAQELQEKLGEAKPDSFRTRRVARTLPWVRAWWKILLVPWRGIRQRVVLTTIGAIDLHDRLQVVWVHVDGEVRGWAARSDDWEGWRAMGERGQREPVHLGDVLTLEVAVVLAAGSRGDGPIVPWDLSKSAVEELEDMEAVPCTSD